MCVCVCVCVCVCGGEWVEWVVCVCARVDGFVNTTWDQCLGKMSKLKISLCVCMHVCMCVYE